jgi:hypothetical protein
MRSKAPPLNRRLSTNHLEDNAVAHLPPPDGLATHRLLRRISDVLQVPPETLYGPLRVNVPTIDADDAGIMLDRERERLLYAFDRIQDPEERRRILLLVQELAK